MRSSEWLMTPGMRSAMKSRAPLDGKHAVWSRRSPAIQSSRYSPRCWRRCRRSPTVNPHRCVYAWPLSVHHTIGTYIHLVARRIHPAIMYCGDTHAWLSVRHPRTIAWHGLPRARYDDPYMEQPRSTLDFHVQRQLLPDEAHPCRLLFCCLHTSSAWMPSNASMTSNRLYSMTLIAPVCIHVQTLSAACAGSHGLSGRWRRYTGRSTNTASTDSG